MLSFNPPNTPEEVIEKYENFLKEYRKNHSLKKLQLIKPKTTKEAFELVSMYYAPIYFFKKCLPQFLSKYGSWHEKAIQAEIDKLEIFMKKAEEIPYSIAADSTTLVCKKVRR